MCAYVCIVVLLLFILYSANYGVVQKKTTFKKLTIKVNP